MSFLQILENLKQQLLKMKMQFNPAPLFIIIHHSGNNAGLFADNEYHKSLWNFKSSLGWYLGYNYWIDYDGKVTQTRDDKEEGAHTIGYNKNSIGICCRGNFNLEQPSMFQIQALDDLIRKKQKEYGIINNRVEGHQHFSNTSCPGKFLYQWLVKTFPN